MTFNDFIHADRSLAIAITVDEYKSVKHLLQEFYSARDIEHIDDFCQFKYSSERFLLCNLYERSQISTPMMFYNAVTFIERIPFANIQFDHKETVPRMILLLGLNDAVERYAEHTLKVDMRNDIVYYPSVTTHHTELYRYVDIAREEEPPVITTQSLEMIDAFLGSDLDIDVITVKEYDNELKTRKLTKEEARELREAFDADLRD